MVDRGGGVGIDNPEGVKTGAEERLLGGHVQGEDVVKPLKPREHREVGKKKHMNLGSHTWLPNRGKERLKTIKGGEVGLVNRWILQKDQRGVGCRSLERLE